MATPPAAAPTTARRLNVRERTSAELDEDISPPARQLFIMFRARAGLPGDSIKAAAGRSILSGFRSHGETFDRPERGSCRLEILKRISFGLIPLRCPHRRRQLRPRD